MWISKNVFLVKPSIALLVLTIAGYYENITNNSIKSKKHIALTLQRLGGGGGVKSTPPGLSFSITFERLFV